MSEWQKVETAPECEWLWTMREGEDGQNECFYRTWPDGEVEWITRDGVTTITHHSFLPPTHWKHIHDPVDSTQ